MPKDFFCWPIIKRARNGTLTISPLPLQHNSYSFCIVHARYSRQSNPFALTCKEIFPTEDGTNSNCPTRSFRLKSASNPYVSKTEKRDLFLGRNNHELSYIPQALLFLLEINEPPSPLSSSASITPLALSSPFHRVQNNLDQRTGQSSANSVHPDHPIPMPVPSPDTSAPCFSTAPPLQAPENHTHHRS